MDLNLKTCTKCQKPKEIAQFYVRKSGRVESRCSECVRAISAAWFKAHTSRAKIRQKAYYAKNKKTIIERTGAYRRAHPEIARKSWQNWYAKNKPAAAEKARKWRAANPERTLRNARRWRWLNPKRAGELRRRWRRENPDRARAASLKASKLRLMRIKQAPGNFTPELWQQRSQMLGSACWYCNEAKGVTIEHVIPLARGGTNFIANLRPTCKRCNDIKGPKTYKEFMEYLLLREHALGAWVKSDTTESK